MEDKTKAEKTNLDRGKNEPEISNVFQETSRHKKKKKKRERNNGLTKLSFEGIKQRLESREVECNTLDAGETVVEMTENLPSKNCQDPEEEKKHKKKKKEKKRKHESSEESNNLKTGRVQQINLPHKEDKRNNHLLTTSCHVTQESGDQKTKKKKERKHECNSSIENIDRRTVSVKEEEVNVESNEIGTKEKESLSSYELTQESGRHKKKKEEEKRNNDHENIDVGENRKTWKETPISRCEVTRESDHKKKKKREKKWENESDVLSENVDKKTGDNLDNVGVDKNEMRKKAKKKKDKKRKKKSDFSVENVGEKTDSVKVKINEEGSESVTGMGTPGNCSAITEESANWTKRKHDESFENVEQKTVSGKIEMNVQEDEDVTHDKVATSKCEGAEDSSYKKKKKKKDKKRKHEIDFSSDYVESSCKKTKKKKGLIHETDRKKMDIDVHHPHGEKKSKRGEKTSKTIGNSEKSDNNENKDNHGQVSGNQWASAEFASVEKKEKFLRLLGAFKPSSKPIEKSNYSAMAMNRKEENAFVHSLEKQYFQTMHMGKEKGVGLGYR